MEKLLSDQVWKKLQCGNGNNEHTADICSIVVVDNNRKKTMLVYIRCHSSFDLMTTWHLPFSAVDLIVLAAVPPLLQG